LAPKPPPLAVSEACALVVRGSQILIVQRGVGGLWERFWEFPTIHLAGADPAGRSFGRPVTLEDGVRLLTGLEVRGGPIVQTIRFGVTKHRVQLDAHRARAIGGELEPGPGLARVVWADLKDLEKYPFGSASRRLSTWVATQGAGRETDTDDVS
ncbi:NUDIX domain-containing protein, partial [Singulisphaera rosea]